ncbi:unnamed protein product [Brachionus calyciflorus]|uniref:Uncharacterized protein n=1 Tax=Brachionus calyciflorus TaxID=104777 RepID=A0A813S3H2_9BILA|nr:unnamed protein product [Brachionus calyciflorus]
MRSRVRQTRGDLNRTRSQQPVARTRRSSEMSDFIESDNIATLKGRGRLKKKHKKKFSSKNNQNTTY